MIQQGRARGYRPPIRAIIGPTRSNRFERASQRHETGAALLIALLLIVLLGIIVAELSRSIAIDARAVLNTGIDAQNTQAALGGVQYAMALLMRDVPSDAPLSLDQDWAKKQQIEIGASTVTVRIMDEARKININHLTPDADEGNELDRLARALRLDAKDIGARALDWMDADDEGPFETGAANRRFLCPAELLRVNGIDRGALYGDNGVERYLTVWSDGKVNINTAAKPVIEALLPEEDTDLAADIVERREQEPFAKVTELQSVPGMTGDVFGRIKKVACTGGAVFMIESKAEIGPMSRAVRAVVRRDEDVMQIIFFDGDPLPK
ncbi:MAG: general secretion pathway protein GspK [Planctomycetes bacterium]|nr:general secretion pathway protein GspK [Planctomycetota bacterium]